MSQDNTRSITMNGMVIDLFWIYNRMMGISFGDVNLFLILVIFSVNVHGKILSSGEANAKVTVKVFSSLTCPACANFHSEIYYDLKKDFIKKEVSPRIKTKTKRQIAKTILIFESLLIPPSKPNTTDMVAKDVMIAIRIICTPIDSGTPNK